MKNSPGNILPLALVMTLMIFLAGLGIGTVVLDGSRRALETDRSVSAYYMADSGIERQLYEVRKVGTPTADLANVSSTYPNGNSWKFAGEYAAETEKIIPQITTSTFEVVDLFDPDNVGPVGIDAVQLDFSNGPDCGGGNTTLEVGYAEWNLQADIIPQYFTLARYTPAGTTYNIPLNTDRSYRLRFRAIGCSVSELHVRPYASGIPKTFPGDLTLAAEGTVGPSTQKIAVTMPKLDVLSGLFNFVVFSECTLVKGATTPVCPP
jgi:hypothetical protein